MMDQGTGAIIMGRLNDKLGPRFVMTLCGCLLGAGYLLMAVIHNVWQLYLFYGIIVGLGMSGVFTSLLSTVARWFVKRRGLVAGVVSAGTGRLIARHAGEDALGLNFIFRIIFPLSLSNPG